MTESSAPQSDETQGSDRRALLVGRDAELDRIRTFLAAARANGGALFVTGEAGVGKTQLLNAAAAFAATDGTRVLRAAGIQFEAEMSYSGLNQVLLPLLDGLSRLSEIHRDALNIALGFATGAPPSRLVISNATLRLLSQAATNQPLLVILDDLPWLDRASAGVLSFVARRLDASAVGLIGASRAGEDDLFDHSGVPDLNIEPLDDVASRQLLETRYPELGPTDRERILLEAQGSPLALVELPIGLGSESGASADALQSHLPLSRRLQALYRSRITNLPPATRRLLLRMALDGTGDVRILRAGSRAKAGSDDLAPAETARLAYHDATTHRLTFHHPLIRSTVVELSDAEDFREAHRDLADAWVDQPDRRAWHMAEATVVPDEAVASQLEEAASRILARGDAVGCVNVLTRSADLSPLHMDRRRRLAAAAHIGAEVVGDLNKASQLLADLRRGESDVEGSLPAAVAASMTLLQKDGEVGTAHRVLVAALESRSGTLDAGDPVVREALYSLMVICQFGGQERLWRSFEEVMARTVTVPLALSVASKTFADPAHPGDAALEDLEAAIAALGETTDPTRIVWVGRAATFVDRIEGCRPALWRVVRDARRGGAVASGIPAMILLARDDFESGDWVHAEQLAAEASQVCEARGYRALIWPSRHLEALIAAGRGEYERAAALSDEIVSWTAPRGLLASVWFASQARGLVALGRSDFEDAYEEFSKISPAGAISSHAPGVLYVLMDLVDAALRTGRQAEAAAHVAAMQAANLARISSRLALTVGAAAAMIAPEDRARQLFDETLALPGIERWQFDLARVRLAYGERLRRQRALVEARVQLHAALAIFERLGARPWVERTTAELRASGQTKPHAGESVLDRLTPQEFEIASLAASGLTNKQIAERLFLSHRTVGGHLHRAFPKLGVATRAALRDALDSLPAEQRPRG